MEVGEGTVHIADHPVLGPVVIEIFQPAPSTQPGAPPPPKLHPDPCTVFVRPEVPPPPPPIVSQVPAGSTIILPSQDQELLRELKLLSSMVFAIHQHLTRPPAAPWWRRLFDRIKHLCGIH